MDQPEVVSKDEQENAASFLKIKVKEKKSSTRTESSILNIKKKLGVSVDELQKAREDLEAEERVSRKVAFLEEIGNAEQILNSSNVSPYNIEHMNLIDDEIMNEEENILMLRSIANRKGNHIDEVSLDHSHTSIS